MLVLCQHNTLAYYAFYYAFYYAGIFDSGLIMGTAHTAELCILPQSNSFALPTLKVK